VSAPLRPVLYGAVNARFVEPKYKLDVPKLLTVVTEFSDGPVTVDWEKAEPVDWTPEALETDAPETASFREIIGAALKSKNYDAWTKQLTASLSATETLDLFRSPSTGDISQPDESERDFRARISHASRESRDSAIEAVRQKHAAEQARLAERLRKAQQTAAKESSQATGQKLQTAISIGASLVGMFLSRKTVSASNIGRATTAARGFERTMKESQDVGRANENVAAVMAAQKELDDLISAEVAALQASGDAATEALEKISVKPKKTNLTVKLVALVWTK
jgi:hypothetical protein